MLANLVNILPVVNTQMTEFIRSMKYYAEYQDVVLHKNCIPLMIPRLEKQGDTVCGEGKQPCQHGIVDKREQAVTP